MDMGTVATVCLDGVFYQPPRPRQVLFGTVARPLLVADAPARAGHSPQAEVPIEWLACQRCLQAAGRTRPGPSAWAWWPERGPYRTSARWFAT